MSAYSYLQVVLRLAFALALGRAASQIVFADAPFSFAAVALAALMVVTAIWLLCGVRTRPVTLLGATLYTAHTLMLTEGFTGNRETVLELALVLSLALPLVAFGGGATGQTRSDWFDPI